MVKVIAHRGLRSEKPENTLDAIAAALSCPGIHAVEFDVELSRDKQAVVLHQETVVPNADGTAIEPASRNFTSRDWVSQYDAPHLSKMNAGSWMGSEFAHLTIPTLAQALALPWNGMTAYIELKDATYWGVRDSTRPAQVVAAAAHRISLFAGSVNVISFNPEILRQLRETLPHIPTTLALWTEWRGRVQDAIREARRCGASTLTLADILVLEDSQWVRIAHQEGVKLHVYPVSPARGEPEFISWTAESQRGTWQKLVDFGVDAIVSDFARETAAQCGT
jgi:glycerophosphoryl diester phosphodiesterase